MTRAAGVDSSFVSLKTDKTATTTRSGGQLELAQTKWNRTVEQTEPLGGFRVPSEPELFPLVLGIGVKFAGPT